MWPARYFTGRYWAARFFAKIGAAWVWLPSPADRTATPAAEARLCATTAETRTAIPASETRTATA